MSLDYQELAGKLMDREQVRALQNNAEDIRRLAESADGQRVRQLMGDEGKMARALEQGDAETLKQLMQSILSTQEGARLARQLTDLLQ